MDIIYVDFSKAFDQIRHDLLAVKLAKLSMPFNFLKIIMKFTLNRSYALKINNTTSEIIYPKSSVPQGSHNGPILYEIFTNDLDINNILCYADDAKIYQVIRNMVDRHALQLNIDKLQDWAVSNGLTINVSKTFHVSYGKKMVDSCYFLNWKMIERSAYVRDLGVIFDENLNFKKHIETIARRATQMIGAARRFCLDIKSPIMMSKIFKIYIQPIIDYGSVVWNQERVMTNIQITLAVKRLTRFALNISQYTSPANYYALKRDVRSSTLTSQPPAEPLKQRFLGLG